jgi:hypothetical protein
MSQSKGFDSREIKKYREELFATIRQAEDRAKVITEGPVVEIRSEVRTTIAIELSLMISGITYQLEIPLQANLGRVVDTIVKEIGLSTKHPDGGPIEWEMYSDTQKAMLDRKLSGSENHIGDGEKVRLMLQMVAG